MLVSQLSDGGACVSMSHSHHLHASLKDIDTHKSAEYMDSLKAPSRDEFERIAKIQQEREEEVRRRKKEERHTSLQDLESQHGRHMKEINQSSSDADNLEQLRAARTIQKTFRGHRTRRELRGFGLDADTRWTTALREVEFRESARPRARSDAPDRSGENSKLSHAKENWRKMATFAARAAHGDVESETDDSSDEDLPEEARVVAREKRNIERNQRKGVARTMGLQYFLEMVDLKHRYGSNLRAYHGEWKNSNTNENFFHWLDYGDGRHIDMDVCPRERLDGERVRYLSREERQYYLVEIDEEGRLCWAKNGARIDTTENYRDSIHGIVPTDDPAPTFALTIDSELSRDDGSRHSSSSSDDSTHEGDSAANDDRPEAHELHGMKRITHVSASAVIDKLLRQSVRKNTWIFVVDISFRLYVGIKDSGAFQHSSFLQGSRILAAGSIKVKNGRLSSLSPLSGHYRPPASNFRSFVRSMKNHGVDMSHVSISRSYGVLVGLEAYIKTKKKGKNLVAKLVHGKDKVVKPEELKQRQEETKDKSESAEKERMVLEKERQEERDRAAVKLMEKMTIQ